MRKLLSPRTAAHRLLLLYTWLSILLLPSRHGTLSFDNHHNHCWTKSSSSILQLYCDHPLSSVAKRTHKLPLILWLNAASPDKISGLKPVITTLWIIMPLENATLKLLNCIEKVGTLCGQRQALATLFASSFYNSCSVLSVRDLSSCCFFSDCLHTYIPFPHGETAWIPEDRRGRYLSRCLETGLPQQDQIR